MKVSLCHFLEAFFAGIGAVVIASLATIILLSANDVSRPTDHDVIATTGLHWHPTLEIHVEGEKQAIPRISDSVRCISRCTRTMTCRPSTLNSLPSCANKIRCSEDSLRSKARSSTRLVRTQRSPLTGRRMLNWRTTQ